MKIVWITDEVHKQMKIKIANNDKYKTIQNFANDAIDEKLKRE
jgi:hypothetical protein